VLLICLTLADFPQWRGPNRDGVVAAHSQWPEKLQRKWSVPVGEGHASPVLGGNKLYVFSREKGQEQVAAVDLSGKVLWRQQYPAPYKMNSAAMSHGEGPKSTPLLDNGRLFTFGISGILSAWDASTGRLLWRKDFSKRFKETSPLYGTAMSPLVEDGLLLVYAGGNDDGALLAFDPAEGNEKWQWKGDGPGYSSPVVVVLGGVKQAIMQSQEHLISVDVKTGALLWQLPYSTDYAQNIVTPVIWQGLVVYSGIGKNGAGRGMFAVRPAVKGGTWSAELVWQNKDAVLYMNSPVVKGDLLFGLSSTNKGQPVCLDLKTGKTLWKGKPRQGDNAALLVSGDSLVMLSTEGELIVAKAAGDAYTELRRYKVADSPTWAHPIPAAEGWVIKDVNSLAYWQ
jgi:outer membrane protein assembly factor BamB